MGLVERRAVSMKRYGNLFEKIVSFENLLAAAQKALKGKKHKNPAAAFYFNLENEIITLQKELRAKTYVPGPIRYFFIREPKLRKIGASEFRDRVVHHAACNYLEPLFEKSYIYHSYACREGKGTHRAIRNAQKFCRRSDYFLKCDIRKYFENIDHRILKEMLNRKIKDPDLLWLLDIIINSAAGEKTGIPIGNLTSQHFANFYLDKLDHFIKDKLQVNGYLRYMDDFLLFGNDKSNLHQLKATISAYLEDQLLLELKEKATVIAPCITGVPFLGFRIFPALIRIKNENKRRWLKKLKARREDFESGTIDEERYSRCLASMAAHLKIASTYHFRRKIFHAVY